MPIGALFVWVAMVLITIRCWIRDSGKKKLLRFLTVSWAVCLLLGGVDMAMDAAKTYVAPRAVYVGYWYAASTGMKLSDAYDFAGGKGFSPLLMFFIFPFSSAIGTVSIGAAVAAAKERAAESASVLLRIPLFVVFFVLYLCLNFFTIGLYSIHLMKR